MKRTDENSTVTMQEAAYLLNIGVSMLGKLLYDGAIPYTSDGAQVVIQKADVLKYKQERSERRRAAFKEMAGLNQEAGFYIVYEATTEEKDADNG